MKIYYEQFNVGKAKYIVNFHNGVTTYTDGSAFFDVRIFKNKKIKDEFIKELVNEGYRLKS